MRLGCLDGVLLFNFMKKRLNFTFFATGVLGRFMLFYGPAPIGQWSVARRLSVCCDGKKNALFFWNMIKPWPPFAADRFVAVRNYDSL